MVCRSSLPATLAKKRFLPQRECSRCFSMRSANYQAKLSKAVGEHCQVGAIDFIEAGQAIIRGLVDTKISMPRDTLLWSEYVEHLRSVIKAQESQTV